MTDVHELAELLPAPTATSPTVAERDRIDAALSRALLHDSRVSRRRDRALGLAGPAAVAASVAAVTGWCVLAVGGPAGTRPDPRPVVAAPAAVTVLHDAAQAALLAPRAAPVRDDQFVYTRSTVISNEGDADGPARLGAPHEREFWVSQDPDPVRDLGLIREFGQDWPFVSGSGAPVGVNRPTYQWLDALPTDPADLLTEIESDVLSTDELDHDQVVFDRVGDMVREGMVPPATTAALFEAVTRIPGVTLEPGATDALGRHGLGITRAGNGIRSVWVLDPESYAVLGTRDYFLTPGGDVLFNATAVLERGVADAAGEEPGTATA